MIVHVLQNQSQFGTPPTYPIDVFCLLRLMQLIILLNLPLKIIIFICMSNWVSTKGIYIQIFGPQTMHNLETNVLQFYMHMIEWRATLMVCGLFST